MKFKLFILSLFVCVAAMAQDSSTMYMPITMKAKYAAAMVPDQFTISDLNLKDTLKKAVGNATNPELITVCRFRVGTMYSMIQTLLTNQVGGYYEFAKTFFDAVQTSGGWPGLIQQLQYYMANTSQGDFTAPATWLYGKVLKLLADHKAVLDQKIYNGAMRAITPINQN